MVFSKRISLQWVPEEPEEDTHTLVLTSPKDHFVDVRIYKNKYPYIQKTDEVEDFDDVIQWVIVGDEEAIPGTGKIKFNHTVNSQEIMKAVKSGRTLDECRGEPDIGDFSEIEGSEDRLETGVMAHPDTGKVAEYAEVWRSLNPEHTTPDVEVREGYNSEGQRCEQNEEVMTFDLHREGHIGRIVRLGNWVQGVIFEEGASSPLSVMRKWLGDGKWHDLIVYGKHSFPEVYSGGEAAEWERIE